jgi:chemotaxis signal transduction protein
VNGSTRAEELRLAFDRSFVEAPRALADEDEEFLTIEVSGDTYAVRLKQLAGLFADRRIVALPTAVPAFLGVVGFRGQVVPVYGLRALLGYPSGEGLPRWFVLAGERPWVGLAFDRPAGQVRVRREELVPPSPGAAAFGAIRRGDATVSILDTEHLLQQIQQRARRREAHKER